MVCAFVWCVLSQNSFCAGGSSGPTLCPSFTACPTGASDVSVCTPLPGYSGSPGQPATVCPAVSLQLILFRCELAQVESLTTLLPVSICNSTYFLPVLCACALICREATVPAAALSSLALQDQRRPAPPPSVPPPARCRSPAITSRPAPVSTPSAPRCLLPLIALEALRFVDVENQALTSFRPLFLLSASLYIRSLATLSVSLNTSHLHVSLKLWLISCLIHFGAWLRVGTEFLLFWGVDWGYCLPFRLLVASWLQCCKSMHCNHGRLAHKSVPGSWTLGQARSLGLS